MNSNKFIFKHNIRKVTIKILYREKKNKAIHNLSGRLSKDDMKHLAEPVTYIFKLSIKLATARTDCKTTKTKRLLQKV